METTQMCRCCATEGSFKDIKNPYYWMGEEEVYGDMLRECFDVKMSSPEHGGICEVCITQLRNAVNFRKQVITTEERFKKLLDDIKFKATIVKEEISADDEDKFESEDNGNQDDDEDYVPEYDIPIKTETLEVKPKKRASTAKATTSKGKRSKKSEEKSGSDEESPPNAEKHFKLSRINFCHFISIPPIEDVEEIPEDDIIEEIKVSRPRKKTKRVRGVRKVYSSELAWHMDNIITVLESTNATPILSKDKDGYACCYCSKKFPKPSVLKSHTNSTHVDKTRPNLKTYTKNLVSKHIVYLDVTGLKCHLCETAIDSLDNLLQHLKNEHDGDMHLEIKNHIMPLKAEGNLLACAVCDETLDFDSIATHMATHYRNYECDMCGLAFVNRAMKVDHQNVVHDVNIRL